MSIFDKLTAFYGSSKAQLSEGGVASLLETAWMVRTEILQFVEPGTIVMPGQEMWITNVMAEFNDPKIAIVYGDGIGHAFVRISALQMVGHQLHLYERNWQGLVKALETHNYQVKHINYFSCETTSGRY